MGAQDDPCDFVCRLFKVTKVNEATVTYISSKLAEMCHIFGSYQQKLCICYYSVYLGAKYLDNFILAQVSDSLDITSHLLLVCFANNCLCI